MALADLSRMIDVLRRVDRLFENVQKLQVGHEALGDRLLDLEKRVSAIENREELLIERMGSRASEAATTVMNHNMMDRARRVGAMEERLRYVGGDDRKQIE